MKLNNIFKSNGGIQGKTAWYKRISVKAALLVWGLTIITLMIFILGTLPYQRKIIEDRMNSEAKDIAGSIGQVTATAIINNDYGFTVDHCLKIIKQSNSIIYIVITRKDGFSLVHISEKWHLDSLKDEINNPRDNLGRGEFIFSKLANQEVFHYSYPFSYSGIEWGRINVGLSLAKYKKDLNGLYSRTVMLAALSVLIGFLTSIYFTGKLTKPILELDNVSQIVAGGNLNARVTINSDNELGRLAQSFNRMTESLKNSQDILEGKVEERTAELKKINEMLQVEIKEKLMAEDRLKQYNARLEALDEIYRGIISAKGLEKIILETISSLNSLFPLCSRCYVALYDNETENFQLYISKFINNGEPGKTEISTIKRSEVLIGNIMLDNMYYVDDINLLQNKSNLEKRLFELSLRSFILTRLIVEEENIGSIVIASHIPQAFSEENKDVLLIIAKQMAVAIYQAQLQEKIRQHSQRLQNSLSEKEVLLKEIHHRVKNNLQVISSLLYLSSKKIADCDTLNMFKDSQNRVKSIALVHERLYQSKDLDRIDFREYVTRLTNDLFRSYAVSQSEINLNINITNVSISIDTAVPCGLIINELISNSFKYAFPDRGKDSCEIKIDFNDKGNGELLLMISDNGIGLPEEFDIRKTNSLGLQLVETLVAQLEGTLEVTRTGGTAFIISFKDANKNKDTH